MKLRSGGTLLVVAAIASALSSVGCGDGPICQSEMLVDVVTPVGPVLVDTDDDMDGVQTVVEIRSTAGRGATVTVELLDADDEVLETYSATTDADGNVEIEGVTVDGAVALRAEIDAGECGRGEDTVELDVALGRDCAISFQQEPLDNDYYAPLGVLNASIDPDPGLPNFQADIDVNTLPGYEVELFVLDDAGETSAGDETAGADGVATFALSLGQGRQSVRAICTSATGAVSSPSTSTTVFVDTEAPDCAMTGPAPGTTITPALDDNDDLADGVQLTLSGEATGGDVEGEAASFEVTVDGAATTIDGSPLTADGNTSAAATIDPDDVPAVATVELSATDHAGNACAVTEQYDVVYDGCSITVVSPSGTVTQDADGDGANGAQVEVELDVDPACAGQTVTSDCGLDDPSGTVAGDGSLTLEVDWCGTTPCDQQDSCTFTVTSPAGIETSAGVDIDYDDQAPPVSVRISQPALACGGQITPASDIDASTPGVQILVSVLSPVAVTRRLEQTDVNGTQSFDVSSDFVATIVTGTTTFVGFATDDVGNTAQSAACTVTLTDIVVTFLPPAADGAVGDQDGVVVGSDLVFDLCGRTSTAGAAVAVTVDGGPPVPATVNGIDWCVTLTLAASPPSHTIVASATSGPLSGQGTLILSVDLSNPDPITDLGVIADTRQSLRATWTAPDDAGAPVYDYIAKISTTPLDDANFDVTGEVVPTDPPGAPGSPELLTIEPRRTGIAYWVGIAAVDDAGNRGTAAVVGPVTPRFDQTGAIVPTITGASGTYAGMALARGKFNDDEFYDVAVGASGADGAAPGSGAVLVYFGSVDGIGATPDLVIEGSTDFAAFGWSVTAVRWSSTTRDDLVIGEPFAANVDGRVHVFNGGAGFTAGSLTDDDADLRIGVNAVANLFTFGGLGYSLATLDHDGDGRQDLAIGAVNAASGDGAVAVIYGGTVTGSQVLLSDTDTSQLGGAVVHLVRDPDPTIGDQFGERVTNLGRTMGASDATDDLLISYYYGSAHGHAGQPNRVILFRGTVGHPAASGVYSRSFTVNRDVRIDFDTADDLTELGNAAGSVADLNGDGAREIALGVYRNGADTGLVLLIDGNTMGTAGVANTTTTGVTVTAITAEPGIDLFGDAIVNNAASPGADVDGDGLEDLIVTGRAVGGSARMFVWFGGSIPTGSVSTATAQHVIDGPAVMDGGPPGFGIANHSAIWAGDVNGDGLIDISWGDGTGNGVDGSFEVLWDDGT